MFLLLLATVMTAALIVPVAASPSFTDVSDTSVFVDDIEWLHTAGITEGCNPPDNDRFCPADDVTRGQMAAFLVRALNLTDTGTGNHFTDDDNSIFETDIDRLATAGITAGCNPPANDRFCPNDNVTREQMAAFLRRAFDDPPAMVTGLVVTLGGGSEEIDVSWTAIAESDIDHYNIWFSDLPGGTKELLTDLYFGPASRPPDRLYVTDWPQDQTVGMTCYQVSAVDTDGREGARSLEECFDPYPGAPGQVTDVTVSTAGGSGESYVSWAPLSVGDLDHYNVYFSELPGGTYSLRTAVDESVRNGSNRVFFIDHPVDLTIGRTCYKITGVDQNGKEGPTSHEACFMP